MDSQLHAMQYHILQTPLHKPNQFHGFFPQKVWYFHENQIFSSVLPSLSFRFLAVTCSRFVTSPSALIASRFKKNCFVLAGTSEQSLAKCASKSCGEPFFKK